MRTEARRNLRTSQDLQLWSFDRVYTTVVLQTGGNGRRRLAEVQVTELQHCRIQQGQPVLDQVHLRLDSMGDIHRLDLRHHKRDWQIELLKIKILKISALLENDKSGPVDSCRQTVAGSKLVNVPRQIVLEVMTSVALRDSVVNLD